MAYELPITRARGGLVPAVFLAFVLAASLLLTLGCTGDPAEERFIRAKELLGGGDYAGAVDEYEAVVSEHPTSPYAPRSQYMVALVYNRHLFDTGRALKAYSKLTYMYPEAPEVIRALEDMAEIHSRTGEHSRAIEEYERLLKNNPGKKNDYQYLVAMEYIKLNDFVQAQAELRDLAGRLPEGPERLKARYQMAYIHYLNGETKKALEAYDEIIQGSGDAKLTANAMLGKARTLEEAGRLGEALDLLEALRDVYPNERTVEVMINGIKKRLADGP